ncbi:MAG TPA: pilus assembly protein PilM, partial [Planctomycetota bacterium]|nr:pilus assembly protein PilM [Planctomycetota bacterium]
MATGLGIDIGAEHIKVVQAKVSGGSVTVTGALKLPRKAPDAPNMPDLPPDQQEEAGGLVIPESLGAELKKAGLGRCGTLGISGREVILKYLATPPMPPDKLKMFIDMEIGGKLTAKGGAGDGPSVTYDYRILNVPSGLRGDLIIMAGVCKNEYLFGINAALKSAQLSASHITPSCFGMVNAYLRTQQIKENETVVLVDVGHELLEIAILEEKNLYFARSAPGGGKKFTNALDKVLKIGFNKAQEFKHERAKIYPEGAQIPNKQELMFQSALKEGADAIVSAVRSSVMFCRTQAKMPKLDYAKIILSGGGARLTGLREYVEKKAGRPVEVLELYKNLDLRRLDAASARCFEGDVPDMGIALGLAIIDADPDCFHFAMVPEKIRKRQIFLQKTVYGIAAGVVMLASVIPPIQSSQKAAAAQTQLVDTYEDLRKAAKDKKKEFEV